MVTKTTKGIKVMVETFYQKEQSRPFYNQYIFAYRITIENQTSENIKLLKRHWFIFDSNGIHREVEGEGVVGKQPVIEPGGSHQYISGCHLTSDMGSMHGYYQMARQSDGAFFKVQVPEFRLITPFKFN